MIWRSIRWFFAVGMVSLIVTIFALLTSTILSKDCLSVATTYDQIVVLGAGMDPDGTLHDPAKNRVAPAVVLLTKGIAPKLHFTGGRAVPNGPAAGAQMARLAIDLGAPPNALSHEDASLSTLQNALFSADMLDTSAKTLLISEGFHLLRSHASFKWAGFQDIDTCHSTRLRGTLSASKGILLREIIAYPANLLRATTHSALRFIGLSRTTLDPWLS